MSYFLFFLVYEKIFLHILSCHRILLGMNQPYIRRTKTTKGDTLHRKNFFPHTNSAAQSTLLPPNTSKKSEETAMLKEKPYRNDYDDGNIPEIDLPRESDATDVIPDEVPRKDGPGGEG